MQAQNDTSHMELLKRMNGVPGAKLLAFLIRFHFTPVCSDEHNADEDIQQRRLRIMYMNQC